MKGFLAAMDPGSWKYPARIFFDSVFFVWVGIVLMNIITGLMVDTFGSIRQEKQLRSDTLENECFVCGLTRASYEDMALRAKVQRVQVAAFCSAFPFARGVRIRCQPIFGDTEDLISHFVCLWIPPFRPRCQASMTIWRTTTAFGTMSTLWPT